MEGTSSKWIIVKNSRASNQMYKGPTWQDINIDIEDVPEYFVMHAVAASYADMLSEHNPVGFHVKKLESKEKSG